MTHRYLPPALLTNDHVVESFECRSVEQPPARSRPSLSSCAAGGRLSLFKGPSRPVARGAHADSGAAMVRRNRLSLRIRQRYPSRPTDRAT